MGVKSLPTGELASGPPALPPAPGRHLGAPQRSREALGLASNGFSRFGPHMELAVSHLRAGEDELAAPAFHRAYQAWRALPRQHKQRYDGAQLLSLWGQCLFRLGHVAPAQQCWIEALTLVPDDATLRLLLRTVLQCAGPETCQTILREARERLVPGAAQLWHQYLCDEAKPEPLRGSHAVPQEQAAQVRSVPAPTEQSALAIMADVANLDLSCSDQYGPGHRPDYGRLLHWANRHGPLRACMAFVPNIPQTLAVRDHLHKAGFEVDSLRPKRSHGRLSANADTAMASYAVRWASDPQVGRLELWTGDGDFLRVREAVQNAWPNVHVVFRSFDVGTALGIRQLGRSWQPIGWQFVEPVRRFRYHR